ncbi:MAG: hypothetical protein GY774_40830 [Planctomycetes bacterium]|nr:hypothetical protein [Planctomycetota bacterium]
MKIKRPWMIYKPLWICLLIVFCTPALASDIALVTRVIDGDTIELATGKKVRYIGIDTPEINEPLGQEIAEYNRSLVKNWKVRLVYDKDKHDRYGRLLAYVFVDDVFVNALLVKHGLARVMTVKPNTKYKEYFMQLELEAQAAKRGMWSE